MNAATTGVELGQGSLSVRGVQKEHPWLLLLELSFAIDSAIEGCCG